MAQNQVLAWFILLSIENNYSDNLFCMSHSIEWDLHIV